MEITASEFARWCGVSAMAISKKIASGQLIRNSAKKLDTDNPVNRAYLEKKQAKFKAQQEMSSIEAAAGSGGVNPGNNYSVQENLSRGNANLNAVSQIRGGVQNFTPATEENLNKNYKSVNAANEMLNMTLRQLIMRHGTLDNVEKYSKILRDLSVADEREQKMQERRLTQVPKDFVVQRVFGYIDQLMNQLLDVPESICDQVIAVSLTGGNDTRMNVIHIISDNITKSISDAKAHILGELNALRNKYDKQEADLISVAEKVRDIQEYEG